jgi:hypothetical protein
MRTLSTARLARREVLKAAYGRVWDTSELMAEFWIVGHGIDHMRVERKADKRRGSIRVDDHHVGRFYYNFVERHCTRARVPRRPWSASALS